MEIAISKDIRKFKTKDIGMFSFLEAGFIGAALGLGYLAYRFIGGMNAAIPVGGIILIFGFLKPYGMPFWDFLRTVFLEKTTPQCYINETDFEYTDEDFEELYQTSVPTSWSIQDPQANISKSDSAQIIR